MPKTWRDALSAYRYPVVRLFSDAPNYPQWKQPRLQEGDRAQTKAFEDEFRVRGQHAISPWTEVVFWKMASQGGRADIRTRELLDRWKFTQPESLWDALMTYVKQPTNETFDRFRSLFGFKTKVIAIVATFPAFASPDRFPMVDTRIAKWVENHLVEQNMADSTGPQLVPRSHDYGLSMTDFVFMQHWIFWCRHTAQKLVALTGEQWRARDVEMAVFQAQGDSLSLNPLPPL